MSDYPKLLGEYETAAQFIERTQEYVLWGDDRVERGEMTAEEQTQRIRAALADALWWIENRSKEPPWGK